MTREEQIKEAGKKAGYSEELTNYNIDAFIKGANWADNHPVISIDKYIALTWPEIQEYMESPRWDEVCFDSKNNLWFVPEDMIK